MKKITLLLFLTFQTACLIASAGICAAALPSIEKQAKFQPAHQTKNTDNNQKQQTIIGRKKDISFIKKRPEKPVYNLVEKNGISEKISSKSAIIIDAQTTSTLFSKLPDKERQPASTIKILTGLIAIKSLDNSELINVSRHASSMPSSKVYLDTQKKYKADDLINAVLLASANDASVAIAEKIAGSEKEFAEMMTLRAKLWGAKNTVCRTATGLTTQGQKSTARDLALIFHYAMLDEEFAQRMNRTKIKTSYGKTLRNHNKALSHVEGAIAGKTGYTNAARQTYVGQFERDGESIIVAIMGSETMWDDIKQLVEYGFKRKQQISRANIVSIEK